MTRTPTDEYAALAWRLGARVPDRDYGVFKTSFVDGEHPQIGAKRFSVIDCPDWVNVIALTADGQVVLIRQYRVGVRELCLEIPGGMVDDDEEPAAAAARELAEETGYVAPRWQRLATLAPNPAILGNHLHVFLAEGARLGGPPRPDGSEVISVTTVPLEVVHKKLIAGEIDHALVVAAFGHLAFRRGPL
jgi:ADP-ribose pyrophosphatase